jgi:hypothetical protein
MTCPKCKARIGIMNHEIIHDTGVVNGCRCVMCGYWQFDHSQSHKNASSKLSASGKR